MNKELLNKIIAERFFRYKRVMLSGKEVYQDENGNHHEIEDYSRSIESAWRIVNQLNAEGGILIFQTMKNGKRGNFVTIGILKNLVDSFHSYYESEGESFPIALCLAIVKAYSV